MDIEAYLQKWYKLYPEFIDPYHIRQEIIEDHLIDFEEGDIENRLFKFNQYKLLMVSINKIRAGQWRIDQDKVNRFKSKILKGEIPFPIVYDKRKHSIIDGSHRYEAFKSLGFNKIVVYIGQ